MEERLQLPAPTAERRNFGVLASFFGSAVLPIVYGRGKAGDLREVIHQCCMGKWKDALASVDSLPREHSAVQIYIRASILMKLGRYLEVEKYFQTTPVPAIGSWTGEADQDLTLTALSILQIELAHYLANRQTITIDVIEKLGSFAFGRPDSSLTPYTRFIAHLRLAEIHLGLGKVRTAVTHLHRAVEYPTPPPPPVQQVTVHVYSYIGRILLKHGDIEGARKAFQTAALVDMESAEGHPGLIAINSGLLLVVDDKYSEAMSEFESAIGLGTDYEEAIAVNNMAICAVYSGKIFQAIKLMEAAIRKKPSKNLTSALVTNLTKLYSFFPKAERGRVEGISAIAETYAPECL